MVLEARLKLASVKGWREVPLAAFFTGPFRTVMEADELLAEIIIPPLPPQTGGSYQWLTKITAVDETLVGVAALVVMDGKEGVVKDARIALCSVAPTPMRAEQAEEVLRGKEVDQGVIEAAAAVVVNETRPRSRADYRKRMSAVLTERAIKEAIAGVTS
jgi:carbon-monoxide dehydrogenase medium subunit